MNIKYEGEELKELSVKFTGCYLLFFKSFIVITRLCYYGLHTRNSIYNLIANLVSANMKHHGGNKRIQTTFET